MDNFQSAKAILGIFVWASVVLFAGGIYFVFPAMSGGNDPASVICILAITVGLFTFIACQLGLAQIETASNTAAIRDILQRQLDLRLGQSNTESAGASATAAAQTNS